MKKLNITFCSFPDFSGNAKALFNYIKSTYKDNMNYTWIITDKNLMSVIKNSGANAYLAGSLQCDKYLPKTDVFFTTHANLTGCKSMAPHAIYIELWHGIGPKPVGYLTKNMRESDIKWYGDIKYVIDYMIVPSAFWKMIFASAFDINVNQIKDIGLPLLDEIKYSDGKHNLKMVLQGININKYNKILFYLPTFRKGCGRELSINYFQNTLFNFDNYSDSNLVKYLEKNKYLLVIKRHPSDELDYKNIESNYIKIIDNNMLSNLGIDVNGILNACDLLITDYSSVGTEFSFLDRPVIYISKDLNEYYNERGIILDNYTFWTDGITCDNYEDLIKLINKYIGKKHIMKNKKIIYNELTNGGCQNICHFVFEGTRLSKALVRNENKLLNLENENKYLVKELNTHVKEIKKLTESDIRLKEIENSRSWKILEKLRKILKNFRCKKQNKDS